MPRPAPRWSSDALAEALRAALVDALDGSDFDPSPSFDLAVVAWDPSPRQRAPIAANALRHRAWPAGQVAQVDDRFGAPRNLRYWADRRDADGRSVAWQPGADWTTMPGFVPLAGDGPLDVLAPYPASLVKLMVAVGVAHLVDTARAAWDERWPHDGRTLSVADWCEPMLVTSDNDATRALVALLHARGLIVRGADGGERNGLHALFESRGLVTLRLASTTPRGGWFNRDGAGVGHLQMTAWDTVRLLWLLTPDAPRAPWLAAGTPALLLSRASCARLQAWLADQALHGVLSSTLVAGLPGWQRGIAARLPARWLDADGSALVDGRRFPGDVRAESARADVTFAHKTGTTENYVADAGWVEALDGSRRYAIALLGTLGSRHAPHPLASAPWCVPAIGAAVDDWLAAATRS